MAKLSPKAIKIFKTFNLYCCFFSLGLSVAIPGPTLIDLTHLVNTDIMTIALVYTARSVGYLLGSLAGGVLFDMLTRKQTILTIFSFVTAITLFGIPWSRQLYVLAIWMVINGTALGVLDNGGNVYCLSLWGKNSGPFYQALHFMFGVGGLVAPLVAAPFLENFNEGNNSTTSSPINSTGLFDKRFHNDINPIIPSVTYAYSIIGSFTFFVGLLFLVMCILSPIDERSRKEEAKNQTSFFLTAMLIMLTSILILTSMGTEVGYAQMLTTYAKEGPLKLPTSTGSYMTSAYWGSFTASRLAAICLAIKFSNLALIVFDAVMTTIGSIILLLLAPHYEWALWLSSVILGIGIASFFPSSVSWVDQYIPITNKIASLFTVGAAFGEMLIPFLISYFIEDYPDVFLYVNLTSCIVAIIIIVIMYLILKNLPQRFVMRKGIVNVGYTPDNKL